MKTAQALELSRARADLKKAKEALEAVETRKFKAVEELLRAQAALEALGRERSTWGRQMADIRGERDSANEVAEKALEMLATVSADRDNLEAAIIRLATAYESDSFMYSTGQAVADDIRAVIQRQKDEQ